MHLVGWWVGCCYILNIALLSTRRRSNLRQRARSARCSSEWGKSDLDEWRGHIRKTVRWASRGEIGWQSIGCNTKGTRGTQQWWTSVVFIKTKLGRTYWDKLWSNWGEWRWWMNSNRRMWWREISQSTPWRHRKRWRGWWHIRIR